MKILMGKIKIATLALILMFSMSASLTFLPAASAHSPTWNIVSFAYIFVAPDPVGVNQPASVIMWVDTPMPSATVSNDIRRHDYTLTITKPDGQTETKSWPIVTDTTGVQFSQYIPTQVGVYTLKFNYPAQTYTWSGTYQNDTFMAASATSTLTVQQQQLPNPITSYPLPTEYWVRPIESQNTDWWTVASNWLRGPYIRFGTSATEVTADISGRYTPDGIAPESAHVMWSKPIQDAGVVGGSRVGVPGNTYYMGGSYNVRFAAGIAMYGRLYYQEPYGNSGGGGDYVAVDLKTGKELWRTNVTAGAPSFGYLYDFESGNQHGVLPEGLLFTNNFARAYDPGTGVLTTMNITNVPSGTEVVGTNGEILRYAVTNAGTAANPNWRLTQWNSSRLFVDSTGMSPANWYSGNVPGNCPIIPANPGNRYWNGSTWVTSTERTAQGYASITTPAYDFNISLPLINSGSWSIIRYATFFNEVMLLQQGSLGVGPRDTGYGANITAVSLKPGSIGQVLWTRYYQPAPGNVTRKIIAADTTLGLFVTEDKETLQLTGFSLTDGSQVWTSQHAKAAFDTLRTTAVAAWGKLFCAGYDGIMYAYNLTNGDLIYTYGNGGAGNSTFEGLGTAYGEFPIFIDVVADGKVILASTEHSPGSPWYKNALYRCIEADTGKELWTIMGWGTGMYAGGYDLIADGTFVFLNCYDMQLYAIGKGPSAITVDAPMTAVTQGSGMIIRGTVTDISAGTEKDVISRRFPNGVPAVSDASQTGWMEYVYMQKPRPTDATGVDVKITVIDPNSNTHEFTTTSDSLGAYSLMWTPPVPGKYTVIAQFQGSESYWPSTAETSFGVDQAPAPVVTQAPTAAPTTAPPTASPVVTTSPTQAPNPTGGLGVETYIAIGAAVIVVAVAAAALAFRRRQKK